MAQSRPGRPAGLLAGVVLALLAAPVRAQQQGSIQLSTNAQVLSGDPDRRGAEATIQPDFGLLWSEAGSSFGRFTLETIGTRRGDDLHLGRTSLSLRDAKRGGVSWTFEGGDIFSPADAGNYQFSNLATPGLAFTGGLATATSKHVNFQIMGGRSNALRNIFGSDPQMLGQTLALARVTLKPDARWMLNARAARTRTSSLAEFTRSIDASEQAGGGARFVVTPALQFVADGSYVQFRATGATETTRDYSYLAGMHVLLARGSLQVNTSRFSPGDLPVVNAALQDRSGVFASGDYDLIRRIRLFAGWESVQTNINPSGVSVLRPEATSDRGFAGVRFQIAGRSTLSLRYEDGGRIAQPVATDPRANSTLRTVSDTGAYAADWQTSFRRFSAFGRVARRENIGISDAATTFTQDDASGQIFLTLSQRSQIFGGTTVSRQTQRSGSGSTFMQFSAGVQQQIIKRGLWLRLEGTGSRNRDLASGLLSPRDAISVGFNGQLTRYTTIGVNVYADRAPVGFDASEGTWLARSTLHIVHTIPTGAVRVANAGVGSEAARVARGSGSILGSVYADWNGNGQPDPGEELLAGIPMRLGAQSTVTTARDGQFSFLNVPAGSQQVGLDLNALPVDFDPPEAPDVTVDLSRGETRRVAFGLLPLGDVHGLVVQDENKNGQADPGEPMLAAAVLTLDGGQRSERVRPDGFTFEAVRAGTHALMLLKESLPEGAVIVGEAERAIAITREHPRADVVYVVRLEKRPEVRKVFPPKIGANLPKGGSRGAPVIATPPPAVHAAPPSPAASAVHAAPAARPRTDTAPAGQFTIQIAALSDPRRAREMVNELKAAGFAAYLMEPGASDPDGPYRVRVGRFVTRAMAQRMAEALEARTNEKLWVTRAK